MIKVTVIFCALFIVTAQSAVRFDPTRKVADRLNVAFRERSGNVAGKDKMLFRDFKPEECCSEEKAFEGHPNRIDLVIALDESGSVGLSNFKIMKTFIKDILSHFVVSSIATRVAVVTWSTRVTLEFDFDKYINHEGVNNGIDKIKYSGGWTATADALNYIRTDLFSKSPQDAKKLLFVITDGRSNRQTHDLKTEGASLKIDLIEAFAFGIGDKVNDIELRAIASIPTHKYKFNVETFSDLASLSHLIETSTSCKNGAIMHDACARRCNGRLTDCTRVRKNILDMSDLERCRYIRAVKRASTDEQFKNDYDKLIATHQRLFSSGIHDMDIFLPWHRWYIVAYENLLQKVDCRVTVPYWDWSLDSTNAFTTDLWDDDYTCETTGLGGNGDPSNLSHLHV